MKIATKTLKGALKLNAAACYIRKSASDDDVNTVSDDVGDAVKCVNPASGYTGG